MAEARLKFKVVPRASRTELCGKQGEAWRVRLKAPPVDGKANEELVKFLAHTLKLPKRAVILESGHSAKLKRVRLEGLSTKDAESLLARAEED